MSSAATPAHDLAGSRTIPAKRKQAQPLPLSLAGGRNPWVIATIISIATFMEVLDTSIADVSLRHIAGSMSASLDESTWVLTSYLVSNAIILPISGWLASVIGRKRFYMACVFLFTVSSLMCGFCAVARSIDFLSRAAGHWRWRFGAERTIDAGRFISA